MPPTAQKPGAASKNSEKTRDKVLMAIEKAMDSALEKLADPEALGPREHKELLGLLIKAAEQMQKYAPPRTKPFHATKTDLLLLELYAQRKNAGTI